MKLPPSPVLALQLRFQKHFRKNFLCSKLTLTAIINSNRFNLEKKLSLLAAKVLYIFNKHLLCNNLKYICISRTPYKCVCICMSMCPHARKNRKHFRKYIIATASEQWRECEPLCQASSHICWPSHQVHQLAIYSMKPLWSL